MSWLIHLKWFLFFVLLLAGCSPEPHYSKLKNIDRVLMHEPSRYSFLINGKMHTYPVCADNVKFVFDVRENEKVWMEGTIATSYYLTMTIHLHSPKEINGAGWDAGKNGSGQTEAIE